MGRRYALRLNVKQRFQYSFMDFALENFRSCYGVKPNLKSGLFTKIYARWRFGV